MDVHFGCSIDGVTMDVTGCDGAVLEHAWGLFTAHIETHGFNERVMFIEANGNFGPEEDVEDSDGSDL